MVTDQQVRRFMKFYQSEGSVAQASSKAGMDEKTARRYRELCKLPSQLKKEHNWRTRFDSFADVWEEIEELLNRDESIQAITIFEYLGRKYPGKFSEGQLRTLQRRMKIWRAQNGPKKEVYFTQEHHPGRQAQSDFTHMRELGVTIQGEQFDHLIYHFTLTYSNWESVTVCFSESLESLSTGLQNALWKLGAVPREHRTDSLTAAVNNLNDLEQWNRRYRGLMEHYSMKPSHSTPGRGHENGDVEQSHHRFKNAAAQELILRGSKDFGSREEYDAFLNILSELRNAPRREKLKEEMELMRDLPDRRIEDYQTKKIKVTRNSTIIVKKNIYSVNSQLMGETIEARIFVEHIEIWYAGKLIDSLQRLRGEGKHSINYRHIIHSLERKPGAFANYRYQEARNGGQTLNRAD